MSPLVRSFSILLFILLSTPLAHAQSGSACQVKGKVVDANSEEPLEYCTVIALHKEDSTVIDGATTNENGEFSLALPHQDCFVKISYLGYHTEMISSLPTPKAGLIDLGLRQLKLNSAVLKDVSITDERSHTVFQLDKRIFNVGKDLSNSGGSALDVLNTVPSVEVSLEGAVQLRGNSNVQMLINGKPSVLANEGNNALASITADMIERVEVITNPSAKYDAEGTTGIINLVLKKEREKGLNGSVTLNTGYPNNHSLGLSVNYRTSKLNIFSQAGLGLRRFVSISEGENLDGEDDDALLLRTEGDGEKNENFANVLLGSDFYLNKWNTLTLSGHFAYELESEFSKTDYQLEDHLGDLISAFRRSETTSATNPKWQYDLQHHATFKRHKDQSLTSSLVGSFFGKDKISEFNNTAIQGEDLGFDQQTRIDFQNASFAALSDYVHPITDKTTLEAGAKYDVNINANDSEISNLEGQVWVIDSTFTNQFRYDQYILATYTTLAHEGEKWGVKGGMRMEHTDASANEEGQELGSWNYVNFFPSIHSSYKFSENTSFQVGYSRRIHRPRLWDLNPYFSFRDNYNLSVGNPELQPEFSHAFEITAIQNLDKVMVNASLFHTRTSDVIEDVVTIEGNVSTTAPANIGASYNTGMEVNTKVLPASWISIFLDLNATHFRREGSYLTKAFDFTNFQWSSRLNLKVELPLEFDTQISVRYQSPEQQVFLQQRGYAFCDFGLRKKFLKGKMIANLSIRDVFNSRIQYFSSNQEEVVFYQRSQRGRYSVVGLSYSFGKGEAMEFSGMKRF